MPVTKTSVIPPSVSVLHLLLLQLIPLSFIAKEAQHVEGFAPELALVTKGMVPFTQLVLA